MPTTTIDDASSRQSRRAAHLADLRVDGLRAFGVPEHLVPDDINPDAEPGARA
ncbi:hypothetical protein GCM10025868_45450 [Angustibacter aerolatus]|uniref:Uncharacterized protein n=1 Tax=Angustibacter aerolatus TaxID=1162965 RepID=A0ABQ6JLY9_9ACTN|nr:hypothetical protein [Angustibacter aerolatus]GMA89295.1 hypothetical protein GCM10025868_45450 [Angustibacter aerolatus]